AQKAYSDRLRPPEGERRFQDIDVRRATSPTSVPGLCRVLTRAFPVVRARPLSCFRPVRSTFSSEVLNTLSTRGYIHQCSDFDGLDRLAVKSEVNAYIGFDCTARSLHVGSLVQIMLLYWAQQTGQKAIALMGGGTTRVGDPSGRDEGRKLLSVEEIEDNKRGIESVFARFL